MARDFDGANDRLDFGSDASIDNLVPWTLAFWMRGDLVDTVQMLLGKNAVGAGWALTLSTAEHLRPAQRFLDPATVTWEGSTNVVDGAYHHCVVSYNRSSFNNDPSGFVDGAVETFNISSARATGLAQGDGNNSLLAGESGTGTLDLDGLIGFLVHHNAIFDAAMANRHRWWGTPGGGMLIQMPLMTDKLANEGTATANATATGTTVASLPKVERNWGMLMGVGR